MKLVSQLFVACFLCLIFSTSSGDAQKNFTTSMRSDTPINEKNTAPEFSVQENSPTRRVRDYPMQPPTIPHPIEGMILIRTMNQCLVCHNKNTAPQIKAPAVAVSHYENRDGEYLSEISARRYFCTQCHVPQSTKTPVVENNF